MQKSEFGGSFGVVPFLETASATTVSVIIHIPSSVGPVKELTIGFV